MTGYTYVSPAANNYPGLDRGFNQRYLLEQGLDEVNGEGVYLAKTTDDVLSALNDINNNHTPLSGEIRVISGGHCYEDFTFNRRDDASTSNKTRFVIDLSNMRGITEENVNGVDYIVVEPGASNWLIQQTLHSEYGATLPGGSCYSVCAGGHISGGGYGLLSRLHGLTVDYLAGVEMVIPDETAGFAIRAFDEADSDSLNWASRGAVRVTLVLRPNIISEKTRFLLPQSGHCSSPYLCHGVSLLITRMAQEKLISPPLCKLTIRRQASSRVRPSR